MATRDLFGQIRPTGEAPRGRSADFQPAVEFVSANVRAKAARQQLRIRPNPWLLAVLLVVIAVLVVTLA